MTLNTAGAVTSMTAGSVNPSTQAPRMGVDAGSSASGDETYRIQETLGANTIDRDFRAADASTPQDPLWVNTKTWSSGGVTLDILDLTNPWSGTLDFVYPVRLTEAGQMMLGVFGQAAGPLPAMLPERYVDGTGMAEFRGNTAGYFQGLDGRIWRTRADMIVRANFQSGTIQGNVGNADGILVSPPASPPPPLPPSPIRLDLDFMFNGQISSAAMTFTGAATGGSGASPGGPMTGEVSGRFYGAAGAAADEVGLAFSLTGAGSKYFGVGAGGHQLAPRPFLTPTTLVNMGAGPSVVVSATNVGLFGPRGPGSGVAASNLLNVSPDVWVSLNPGATMDFADDVFRVHYATNGIAIDDTITFPSPPPYSGTFGTTYHTVNGNTSPSGRLSFDHHNIGFDLGPSLAGALNNVFLMAFTGDLFDRNQNYGFVVFGTQAAAADMPSSGSATFKGQTRGVYLDTATQFYRTASDLELTANFATGAVNGAATNFRLTADYHLGAAAATLLDFTFSGTIAGGTSTFSGNATSVTGGLGLTGRVEGAFYGDPGAAPDEAGMAYQLGTPGSGAFMAGAGIGAKQ